MNKVLVTLGVLFLVIPCGLTQADSISSSIVCSGATWVSSSVISDARSYATSLFTSDLAVVNRTLNIGEAITALVSGRSTGPMGIDEYTGQAHNQTTRDPTCLFTDLNQNPVVRMISQRMASLSVVIISHTGSCPIKRLQVQS